MLFALCALGSLVAMQSQETEVEIQNPTNAVAEVAVQKEATLFAKAAITQTDFKEIKATELPKLVLEPLAKDFEGATVQKAYVNENQEFKLVLATTAAYTKAASRTVYATKDGEWIKQPKAHMK